MTIKLVRMAGRPECLPWVPGVSADPGATALMVAVACTSPPVMVNVTIGFEIPRQSIFIIVILDSNHDPCRC